MRELNIDFETRSLSDLLAEGAHKYASDPSTGVYVLAWKFSDTDHAAYWLPGMALPDDVCEHVHDGGVLNAWNAQFERLIWWYVLTPDHGFPEPALEQFHCTAARARAHGLPGKLGDAARCAEAPIQKQKEGTRLINTYSVFNVPWEEIPDDDKALWIDYCTGDVGAESSIQRILRPLTNHEWAEYHYNEVMADRGVPVDLEVAQAALGYADEIRDDVNGQIIDLTGGKVRTARERKSRDEWLLPQLSDELRHIITIHRNDQKKVTFAEQPRTDLRLHPDCPDPVVRYLELLDEAGGATISKYKGMLNREIEGRVFGAILWNGAGQTGRFSSMGLQLHNLARVDKEFDPEATIADLLGNYELDNPLWALKQLVRSTITSGKGLSWCDWSAIEGRVAPWLANSDAGEAKLDLFREGIDVYIYTAEQTFGVPRGTIAKDDPRRQAGKLQELALQFLGGVGALKVMGRNYGMHISQGEGERLRDAWRKANPWAQRFGRELEAASIRAMRHPGEWFDAGRIAYAYDGGDWLWCRLPSERLLAYFQPDLETVVTPWNEEKLAVTCIQGSKKPKVGEPWPRRALHGGIQLENVTQAAAADLLRDARMDARDEDIPLILDVHDEMVAEGDHLDALERIMTVTRPWAAGLPLAVEGGTGLRYGK